MGANIFFFHSTVCMYCYNVHVCLSVCSSPVLFLEYVLAQNRVDQSAAQPTIKHNKERKTINKNKTIQNKHSYILKLKEKRFVL